MSIDLKVEMIKAVILQTNPGDTVIWKIGDLEHGIMPSDDDLEQFRAVIKDITGDSQDVHHVVTHPAVSVEILRKT